MAAGASPVLKGPLSGGISPAAPLSKTVQATLPARYAFLDLLRGFALVTMIETHIVNSYLPLQSRHTAFFFWLTFVNGLVAPTFLFASGFSAFLQASRNWSDWLHLRQPFWKQMKRLGFILLVAYYSHLQHFGLSRYLHPTDPGIWKKSLEVDILQCIVLSLIVVDVLILLLRTPRRFVYGAVVLAIGVSIATPQIWAHDFSNTLPLGLALFLNPHGISLFPVFPWICFVLAGAISCQLFLRHVTSVNERTWVLYALLIAAVMNIIGLMGRSVPLTLPGYQNFYTTSPLYVLIRLGCVLMICALVFAAERFVKWVPRWIRLAGQESLLVYGVHLWLIFAVLRGKHVRPLLGLEMGYWGCLLLSLSIIVLMLWLAGTWHRLKRNYPVFSKVFVRGTVATMIVVFVML